MRPPDYRPKVTFLRDKDKCYGVLSTTKRALRAAGADSEYVSSYLQHAMAGDEENLLRVTKLFVDVEE